ncbi:MAG TPA: extracellular solute-binding protein [Acidimicrobiales bacterium]|nr:extracellular solute-binding protein [Acidimicrobiales bacterium]
MLARSTLAAVLPALVLAVAAPAATGTTKRHSGNADVLYAASLQDALENVLGPRFHAATGYTFVGFAGGAVALANEIEGGVQRGDVFISASPSVNQKLEGAANGSYVSWYVEFGQSPLVLGYNPHSSFAKALTTEPWYKVITAPGFRVGRTDPAVDPKGALTVRALAAAAAVYGDSHLASVSATSANVYPEQTLVGLLQSGQLDAGFFYSSEAKAAGIPTIKLGKIFLAATYTVTILRGAPHPAAAVSFVEYLLGTKGRALLEREGLQVLRPRIEGATSDVPSGLRKLLAVQ